MNTAFTYVCLHCFQVNRIPIEKKGKDGRCGACRKNLFATHPPDLDAEQFTRIISRSELPVLVDFWAPWCGPCKGMAPIYEKAAAELKHSVSLVKINTQQIQDIAAQFHIQSIPTLVLFKEGKESDRISGAMDLQNLLNWTRSRL